MRTLQTQIKWCARAQWAIAIVLLLIVAAFYFLGYRPMSARLNLLTEQILQRQRDLMAGRMETKVLPDVAGEVKRLRERLERSHKSIPAQQELPEFIRSVTQLSQQSSLKKFSYKPGVPTRGELVSELPIQLNFDGDFVNVFAFLRNTEEMPRLTRVRGMTVKCRDKSGQVQVQLSMSIYCSAE
jgi:Tfp pilus assembly protein PilO